MARKKGPKKPKLPKYVLVDQTTQEGKGVYAVLADALKQWHSHLREAKIVAAWMVGNKSDKDGRIVLGRMKKTSELDRELAPFDFILIALCAALVAAGILALVQLGLLVYHGILGIGASLTEGETPENAARGNGPRLPSVTETRTANAAQVHSEAVVAPEVRLASATFQRGWDHRAGGYTVEARPEA